jgi:regulatory protein
MNKLNTTELICKLESYCAYQERCEFEIYSKLISLNAQEQEIKLVMNHLINAGFFNQNRFVDSFISGKLRSNKWGRLKIKAALIQKRVDKGLISIGLNKIDDQEYQTILKSLLEKKQKELEKEKDEWAKKQKLIRFLSSKGFEYIEIIPLINHD